MISPHESFDYTAASTGERGGGKVGGGKWEGGGGGEGLNSNTFFLNCLQQKKQYSTSIGTSHLAANQTIN